MRIVSVLLSVLLLAGCGKADPTEKHQKSRDRIVDVSDRIREIDLGDLPVVMEIDYVRLYEKRH